MTKKKDLAEAASRTCVKDYMRRSKTVDPERRFYRIVSLTAIISGSLFCLASVGIGVGLVMVGTVILAEL